MAELAYAHDSKSCGRKPVWVQLPPSAPKEYLKNMGRYCPFCFVEILSKVSPGVGFVGYFFASFFLAMRNDIIVAVTSATSKMIHFQKHPLVARSL